MSKRAAIRAAIDKHGLSARRTCRVAGWSEASWYYRAKPNPASQTITTRLRELAGERPAFGAPGMGVIIRIAAGKSTQNASGESLNGKLRIECLRQHWFKSPNEAREVIEDWRLD